MESKGLMKLEMEYAGEDSGLVTGCVLGHCSIVVKVYTFGLLRTVYFVYHYFLHFISLLDLEIWEYLAQLYLASACLLLAYFLGSLLSN